MKISQSSWNRYIEKLSAINAKAGKLMQKWMLEHPNADTAEMIDYAYAVASRYGEASASLACEMYDATAAVQGARVPAAEPAQTATYTETGIAVNGAKLRGDAIVPQAVERLVKMAGQDTLLNNSLRDGAEWAWVPMGDTCAFCITLASRGWQRASKKAIKGGHAEHIHSHCDCSYAIRFDGKSTIDGYDPDEYLRQYNDAGGDINAMRRHVYSKNKDVINARKRELYAIKKKVANSNNTIYNDSSYTTLREDYDEAVKDGWISALCGFDNYKKIYYQIESEIIGIKTKNNTPIKGQSKHFITRVIGTALNPANIINGVYTVTKLNGSGFRSNARDGVEIRDILNALTRGKIKPVIIDRYGKKSQRFVGDNCIVTINPETGMLVQCNPRRKL